MNTNFFLSQTTEDDGVTISHRPEMDIFKLLPHIIKAKIINIDEFDKLQEKFIPQIKTFDGQDLYPCDMGEVVLKYPNLTIFRYGRENKTFKIKKNWKIIHLCQEPNHLAVKG